MERKKLIERLKEVIKNHPDPEEDSRCIVLSLGHTRLFIELLEKEEGNVLNRLHQAELNFRLEDSDESFHLSIIDRSVYPRVWADNSIDGQYSIIAETDDNFINRSMVGGKDWRERWFGETLDEVLYKASEWLNAEK